MKITSSEVKPGVRRVTLDGRLDAPSSQAVEEEFETAIAAAKNIIVDLEQVSFVGSIGIRLLMTGAKLKAKKGGKMVMVVTDAKIRWVIKSTGTDQIIPVFDNMDAALGAFA
ncbi:MAG: STAS domain-containing protein [Rhodocyclaceae bacterium]|nr:STAS domain-containing protein [Rhodocyclaceae bacterium]MDZ4213800.1 STAS domain-containing protein [Rhodocyclaceae bacterium]